MITSLSNSRVRGVCALLQKAKTRREEDAFVVEGPKMFLEAPIERIREIYISESVSLTDHLEQKLNQAGKSGIEIETVSSEVFRKFSDTKTPQGILCVMKQFHYELPDLIGGESPLLLVTEDIQDPGNLGTMIRTGEGSGITGIVMSSQTVDIYNPKTVRATMGSLYRVPFLYSEDLRKTIEELKEHQIRVYAAHLKGEKSYDEFSYRGGSAFLIGNEGNGLREETAALADNYLKIPMAGKVESLNAAIAAAILTYEASRQRRMS